eukprot:m.36130 g.36130  ORF g.36130 m.36130 type:complete len:451 (-) comp10989_c0_seq1:249-1601(-)
MATSAKWHPLELAALALVFTLRHHRLSLLVGVQEPPRVERVWVNPFFFHAVVDARRHANLSADGNDVLFSVCLDGKWLAAASHHLHERWAQAQRFTHHTPQQLHFVKHVQCKRALVPLEHALLLFVQLFLKSGHRADEKAHPGCSGGACVLSGEEEGDHKPADFVLIEGASVVDARVLGGQKRLEHVAVASLCFLGTADLDNLLEAALNLLVCAVATQKAWEWHPRRKKPGQRRKTSVQVMVQMRQRLIEPVTGFLAVEASGGGEDDHLGHVVKKVGGSRVFVSLAVHVGLVLNQRRVRLEPCLGQTSLSNALLLRKHLVGHVKSDTGAKHWDCDVAVEVLGVEVIVVRAPEAVGCFRTQQVRHLRPKHGKAKHRPVLFLAGKQVLDGVFSKGNNMADPRNGRGNVRRCLGAATTGKATQHEQDGKDSDQKARHAKRQQIVEHGYARHSS